MLPNYNQLVEKIAAAAGISVDEVNQKVDAKCAKLSGLISKEGSAQIVASELGVNLDKEKMKVSELLNDMRKINVVGKIIKEPMIRDFTTKSGNEGKVLSSTLADDTGNIRLVLWDTNQIALFEKNQLTKDSVVEISNASVRNGELHLGSFSDIKVSSEKFDNVRTEARAFEKCIKDLKQGDSVKVRAVIAKIFPPKFFELSKETGKKITDEERARGVEADKRALLGVVLDDGTENIRGVLFGEQINNLGFSDEEINNNDLFMKKKEELEGHEAFFNCNVRSNQLFNTTEVVVNGVEQINIDSLIDSLKA